MKEKGESPFFVFEGHIKAMDAFLTLLILTLKHPALHASLIASTVAIVGIRKTRQSAREKNSIDFETIYKTNENILKAWKIALPIMISANNNEIRRYAGIFLSKENESINTILNTWERAANGIFHNVYDGNFLYKTYGTTVIKLYEELHPFIEARQAKNPRFYLQLSRLYINWKIKRQRENKDAVNKDLKVALKVLDRHI